MEPCRRGTAGRASAGVGVQRAPVPCLGCAAIASFGVRRASTRTSPRPSSGVWYVRSLDLRRPIDRRSSIARRSAALRGETREPRSQLDGTSTFRIRLTTSCLRSAGTPRYAAQARSSSVLPRRPRSIHRSRRRRSPGLSPLAISTAACKLTGVAFRPDLHRLHSVTSASTSTPSSVRVMRRDTERTAVMTGSSGYGSAPAIPHRVHMWPSRANTACRSLLEIARCGAAFRRSSGSHTAAPAFTNRWSSASRDASSVFECSTHP
jgi:hypothetical protein